MTAEAHQKLSRVLVLGYGNPGRRDDGLGPATAARISELAIPGVTTQDPYQLSIEDSVDLAAHDLVWFVDCAMNCAAPFEERKITPAAHIVFDSHALTPETLLALTALYLGAAPEASLLAIRGYEFGLGETLSLEAQRNLDLAVAHLRERIGVLQ
jgi:hydrogenase maturation protease